MKRITALFLILILTLSLTACGEKLEDKVIGTWESEIDFSGVLSAGFAQIGLDESQLPSEKIIATATITLNKDKTCTVAMEIDTNSFETYMQSLSGSVVEMLYQAGEQQGMDRETFAAAAEAQFGMPLEEYAESMLSEMNVEEMLADANTSEEGTWKIEEEKIVVTPASGEDDILEYKDGKLLLDSDEDLSQYGIELPLTFTKK